jgi:tripartite-type tricarboxylate transporter receptor subunit TctC
MKIIKSTRSKALEIFFIVSALIGIPATLLAADSYPIKPVNLIIPFAPGGSNDILGRILATKLSVKLGKPVVPINKDGGGGIIGMDYAAHSEPDGYTLVTVTPTYPIVSSAYNKLPFDPDKAFTTVSRLGIGPGVLVAYPGLPVKSAGDLITLAKQKPGTLNCGASGVGSYQHVAAELFNAMADVDIVTVQYKGGGPAIIGVMGGYCDTHIGTLTTTASYIKSGKLRLLGVTGIKRTRMLPDAPTVSETGLPGYDASTWWGILAPAGTPSKIVDRLNKEIKDILDTDEVKKLYLIQGAEVDHLGPDEFRIFVDSEKVKWGMAVKKAKIRLN